MRAAPSLAISRALVCALFAATLGACNDRGKAAEKPRAEGEGSASEPASGSAPAPVPSAQDSGPATDAAAQRPAEDSQRDAMPPRMRCLVEAYPEVLCGGDATHVRWCDGTVMPWDDGVDKRDHETLLDQADLEDQMAQAYRPGRDYQVPIPLDWEPGRVRHSPFFLRMYGATESAVRDTLTYITWLPHSANRRIRVTRVNGVHEKLEAVSREIEALPDELVRAVSQTSGPFYWRDIKGTQRKSMHSFAIAFDVGLDTAYYWRWSKPGPDGRYAYKNAMPMEIVEIFERHGFIWGGKWYHFDTPHFEYRPELLHPDCVAGQGAE